MPSASLLLIDLQKGVDRPDWGVRNNPQVEANVVRLLAHWAGEGLAGLALRHDS
jgi:hypothetical protein